MTDELSVEAKKRLAKLEKRLKKIVDEYKEETKGMTLEEALGVSEILGHDPKAPTPRVLMTDMALDNLPEKTLADFEPKEEWMQWVPQELPNFRYFEADEEGELGPLKKKYFTLTVDGVTMAFQVGTLVSAPPAFWHLYKNQEDGSREFIKLQKRGPEWGPHSQGGPGGLNTWYFRGESPTAWLDIDGKYLDGGKYIMYKGVPVPVPDDFKTLEGWTVKDGKGQPIGDPGDYPENEPEPEWHKTNPFKKVTNAKENKPERGAKQRNKVTVSTGSDEQSKSSVERRNSRSRKIS